MRHTLSILLLAVGLQPVFAQQSTVKNIAAANPPSVALGSLQYLASDALKGRGIDRPEINTAAKYIADQLKAAGAKPLPGAADYFQHFTLQFASPATTGDITVGTSAFKLNTDFLQTSPINANLKGTVVTATDTAALKSIALKGKIVLLNAGKLDMNSATGYYMTLTKLQRMLKSKGAVALIERWIVDDQLWAGIKGSLSGKQPVKPEQQGLPPAYILNTTINAEQLNALSNQQLAINITGNEVTSYQLKNVMAYIPGTDAGLKNQYVLLSSHYDHLGVAPKAQIEEGKLDSIFNGARDNASGTAAVIAAARYFGKHPAKRSMLFITYTAEEAGLLGSTYYAAHPVLPLARIVYNLNIDNASYNDTKLISLVGLGRTSADEHIKAACAAYGLTVNGDPTGGQLFAESDNYPLAVKGVPAPTFSLGMKSFDETITNRYHRLSDEFENLDKDYIMKFFESFTLAAKMIADDPAQPKWTPNDQLEGAWHKLYNK